MNTGLTPSEQFVNTLCEKAFLKLWTHPNPKGKKGKELCDCLIVCSNHIVIISVKEIQYKDTGDITGAERWIKSAIEKSASQIWGAERWLDSVETIERHDGRIINLPPKTDRSYHRISVSLGSKGEIPLEWGEFGNGFVHICDEKSTKILFELLDTITDFVEFLTATEELVNETNILFEGGFEDLIAMYIRSGYTFDFSTDTTTKPDQIIISNDIWDGFIKSGEFKAIQTDFKSSYMWDRLIEIYSKDLLTGGMFNMFSKQVTDNEMALITMSLQPRRYRANLADSFIEFLNKPELKIASRAALGYANTAFVFLIGSSSDREYRSRELGLRCLIIRGRFSEITTVIGIATDRPGTSEIGYSSDIVYMYIPEWTKEDEEQIAQIQNELGFFKNLRLKKHRTTVFKNQSGRIGTPLDRANKIVL